MQGTQLALSASAQATAARYVLTVWRAIILIECEFEFECLLGQVGTVVCTVQLVLQAPLTKGPPTVLGDSSRRKVHIVLGQAARTRVLHHPN